MMGLKNRACFYCLSALFLCVLLDTLLYAGADTLSVGESISGNETIVSEGDGNFELGFFTLDNTSGNYYIGIWYRKIPMLTPVWVANRDKPLFGKYLSHLKLSEDGNLVILDSLNSIIWSTNLSSRYSSNSIEAALLDSGNLVLRNVSNPIDLIWQSFDHPTDTLLQGGRIGLNKRTNTSQILTSWKGPTDPSPGVFSFQLNPDGSSEYLIYREGLKFWSTGTWKGHTFSQAPGLTNYYFFNFSYSTTENENYLTYNSSYISRFVLSNTGHLYKFIWNDASWGFLCYEPGDAFTCWIENFCGPFSICRIQDAQICSCLQGYSPRAKNEWSSGCVSNSNPELCVNDASENVEKYAFLKMANIQQPRNPQTLAVGSSQACEAACLNSCPCNAFRYDGNCYVWEGDLVDVMQVSEGSRYANDLYLKIMNSTSTSGGNKNELATGAIAGPVSGVIALLGLLVVLIWTRRRRSLVENSQRAIEGYLVSFSYRDLQVATKNFSERLGKGSFGSVFKGTLSESTVVAVKKLEGFSQGSEKQFRAEVSTIGTIQHVNLVRLRGFCCQGARRLLVYDFIPMGSLDSHLFHGKNKSQVLDWKTRYQIALGTARGLAYLHEKCRECIIHCDIKPENILLDAEFCPKVADFGMAKLLGRDFSRALTTMRGTIGYLAPEWISGVAITAKADVYSYGMMLFELISGRRNSKQSDSEKFGFFPIWAASKINGEGEILSLLDYRLEGKADLAELKTACKVASWCIQDEEVHRPSMGLVVQILEGLVEVSTPPIPKILQALVENNDENTVVIPASSSNQNSQASTPTSSTSSQTRSITLSSRSLT